MKRALIALAVLIATCLGTRAQSTVTVIGPITPGDCAVFNSTTVLKDSGTTGCFGGYTFTQLTALLNVFTATTQGLVPASGGNSTNLFLNQAGTFTTPGGGSAVQFGVLAPAFGATF